MSAPTVHEAIEGWFEARAPRKDSPRTVQAYRDDLRSVLDVIAVHVGERASEVRVHALTLQVMRAAFATWSRDRAAATVRRAHSVWSGFFEYLVSEDHLPGSPMPGVAKPKAPRRLPRAFAAEDAARIVDALNEGAVDRRDPWPELDRALVLLTMVTGMRSAEVLALNVGDLLDRRGAPAVRVRGKGDADRQVPIEPVLLPLIADYLDTRRARFPEQCRQRGLPEQPSAYDHFRPTDPLFVDRKGERMRRGALSYLVTLVYRAAGVDGVRAQRALVHALRHTAATRMAENGASATEIMRVLGHRSLNTSQTYIDATGRELRAAAATSPVYGMLRNFPPPDDSGVAV